MKPSNMTRLVPSHQCLGVPNTESQNKAPSVGAARERGQEARSPTIVQLLAMPQGNRVEFEPPRTGKLFKAARF